MRKGTKPALTVVLPLREDHNATLGMYAPASSGVQVGEFNIRPQRPGYVWVERDSGEGAEFRVDLLETAIGAFYAKYF